MFVFKSLKNPIFARLYLAQTINLLGDALSWVGLALLVVELAGSQSGLVLSITLTLRVTAFVLLSPIAGTIGFLTNTNTDTICTTNTNMNLFSQICHTLTCTFIRRFTIAILKHTISIICRTYPERFVPRSISS
jgi:hypothetical protein